MTTIRQLAELAGVSHSTVSRALRGDPRITAEVTQRIRELADRYHYRPNRLAQGALTGKSTVLGCVLDDVSLPFESRILRGVLEVAYAESFRVLVLETNTQLPHARQAIHTLLEQRVEGMLITSVHQAPIPAESFMELRSHGTVPVVLDFTRTDASVDRVCTDETKLGELAVDYLHRFGHREIAYVGPAVDAYRGERARAIRAALQRRGLPTSYLRDWGAEQYQDFHAGRMLGKLLTVIPHPTAIICWEDRVAAKLIQAAAMRGLSVPGDISIIGCANLDLTAFTTPAITSIEQHPEGIGRQACRLLLRRLSEREETTPAETVLVSPSLVERASCAPAKRR